MGRDMMGQVDRSELATKADIDGLVTRLEARDEARDAKFETLVTKFEAHAAKSETRVTRTALWQTIYTSGFVMAVGTLAVAVAELLP